MGLQATFRPLDTWPGKQTPSYSRKRAPFRIGYAERLELLEHELSKLGAKEIVIQAQFEPKDIRNDGWPRSSARTKGPAIIVSFKGTKGPLSFPCDRYDSWEDNLYAIALSLEALRAVDRHGVTQNAEQYRGWQQIAAPAPENQSFATARDAAAWLARIADSPYAVTAVMVPGPAFESAYKTAARKLHPDAGGTHDDFVRLQQAARIIREGK